MSKKTTTASATLTRSARDAEVTAPKNTTSAPGTTLPADAPAAPHASAEAALSPEPTLPATAPTSAPEAPTGSAGTRAEGGEDAATRAEKKSGTVQVVTRFPAELAARLDRFTDSLRSGRYGLRVSRADAVRILVSEGLAAHEAGNPQGSPAGKSH